MTSALVLGGGGPVGIGWEAGLAAGLRLGGVDLADADTIIGTSAGSVVGFTLASGREPSEAVALLGEARRAAGADTAPVAASALEQLIAAVAEAASDPAGADAVRARLGRIAAGASTISEDDWLSMFAELAGAEWPASFCCTAVDVVEGKFKVWTGSDRVALQRAVASSCAVPGVYPPVEIDGVRYMDGGVRDLLNADVAAGSDAVAVVSCTLLELPPGLAEPALQALFDQTRGSLDALREGGARVEVVVPSAEMLEISSFGLDLMNFAKVEAAYQAGVRQAAEELGRMGSLWGAVAVADGPAGS